MKTLSFFALIVAFILGACSPFQITRSEGEPEGQQPAPIIATQPVVTDEPVVAIEPVATDEPPSGSTDIFPTFGYQPVRVVDVYVEVSEGSPVPVLVDLGADLPDICAQVEYVETVQDGDTFEVRVGTVPSTKQDCLRDTVPFRMKVPLNVVDLPAGSYTVDVNGVSADFSIDASASTATDLRTPAMPIYKDDLLVDDVRIEVGVGSPLPVHAVVSANLPKSCGQLGEILMYRADKTFFVHLTGHLPAQSECNPDTLPLRLEIPLNLVNLPEGTYEVNVNGVTTNFNIPIY
jgi:hypothetical protein